MNVFERLAKIGLPLLGAALPVPGGAAIGAALAANIGAKDSKPESILAAVTSSAEKLQAAQQFQAKHEEALLTATLQHEARMAETRAGVVKSEAQGESWLQRNWRPLTMVSFVVLLFLYWFGIQPENVSDEIVLSVFGLLKIGIGGYIGSRGVEKTVRSLPQVLAALKGKGMNND